MAYEFFHCDLDTKHEFKHLCASSVLKFKPIINHQLCCLVAQSFPTLCDLMDCSRQVSSVLHYLLKFAQIHVHGVGDAIKPSHPLSPPFLLPSVFPSVRVFSNELALRIRWPEYWSFSFNISTSSEYSGLISFRIDWSDLLVVQGTLKSLLKHHSSKASIELYKIISYQRLP